jgi:asparagine synthase (glutamine-hydrolysing)
VLAFAWPWPDSAADRFEGIAGRLTASLCAGIGGKAASTEIDGLHYAYRPLRPNPALARSWRPAIMPDGSHVAFHGYFDNAPEIAAELGVAPGDVARLYGAAVDRWGDEADKRIVGEYCTIIARPQRQQLRLSRSPLVAPPLHYYHDSSVAAAASVPRAILACGIKQQLNRTRLADSALFNLTDEEATWFENVARVPLGSIVEIERGQTRRLSRYYDILALPDVRMGSDAEYIARASELLDEGVRCALAGSSKPGATLSSGLDSPQVAVRAAAMLPSGQKLPTFTFHPEKDWSGNVENGMSGDERPFVEKFAAMHPDLDPHFTANEGSGHDHRWNELFHLMGGAPSGMCNMYVFHGIWALARDQGCDRLLLAEWGNFTFSDKGEWGFVEYLLKGRWRQLWLALVRHPNDQRSLPRRFIALSLVPLLPKPLWKLLKRLWHPQEKSAVDRYTPLNAAFRATSSADQRLADSGLSFGRYQPRNHRHALALRLQNADCEGAEIYQAFEQLYGVSQRDPTAYRPFVEFCCGLPTHLFMRDGQLRWLAKQMAKGIMPEVQRENRLNGRWDADWHLRIGRRREDYLAELDRIETDDELAIMLDIPRLREALEDFPDEADGQNEKFWTTEFAVPRGLLTARFVKFVEGRNTA